jgi:hypothetical protein
MSTMKSKSTPKSDKPIIINDPNDLEPDGPEGLRWAAGSRSHMFNTVLLNSVVSACWCPSGMTQEQRHQRYSMTLRAVASFGPKDEIEGMIAAQAVAMHVGAMECFRRSMVPEQPGDAAARLRKDGASLARGMVEMIAALDRKRGKSGNQVVRVEHVTVQPGGQAIVGNVTPGKLGGGSASEAGGEPDRSPARLAHDITIGPSLPALRSKDAERVTMPVSGNAER